MSAQSARVINLEEYRRQRESRSDRQAPAQVASAPLVWVPVWVWVPFWPMS
jgi:hypothetical protein